MQRRIFEAEHDAFRSSVRALLSRILTEEVDRNRERRSIGRDLWIALGGHGFLGFMVPEAYGGGGINDFRYNAVLGEELTAYGVAYASSIGINTDVMAPYLLELASAEQQERWLPAFCSGELITAIAMTEPTAGSDLAAIRTTACRNGADWIMNGSKTFITNGASADLMVVAASTAPEKGRNGISLFLVDSSLPGVQRGRKLAKVGQPESDTSELFFTDVRLTEHALLGEEGAGFGYMMKRLPQERLSVAVVAVAHARRTLDVTLEYVKERHAFGQAIGHFQHNKFALADLHARIEVTQVFVDACIASLVTGAIDAIDAAMAKLLATELQGDVADFGVQMFGGSGYMEETSVARAWVDARVTRIYAGSSEIMRELIGRSLGL